jgi:hypothetical protein
MQRLPGRLLLPAFLLLGPCAAAVLTQGRWTEVRTPHFTVVTNADAKDGRKVAEQFERFRAVFERLTDGGIAKGRCH